jgi:preprotein translocase subunit SecD
MSKRARLLIVLLVIVVFGAFLYPTFKWYFLVSDTDKELAASSREQIRIYAQDKAEEELGSLSALALEDASMPEEFTFLSDIAKENYKLEQKSLPNTWSVVEVFKSLGSETAVFDQLEARHRTTALDLKEKSANILQLGLDLSGGMSILLQADMESLGERLGHFPTNEEQDQALDRAMEILNNRIDQFGLTEPQIRRQGENQIYIELPGAADPDVVYRFLRGKGSLNFHIVDDDATAALEAYLESNPAALGIDLQPKDANVLEAGRVVRGFYTRDQYGADELIRYLVTDEEPGLDGTHIQNATVGNDSITGRPVINFTLDREGGEIFYQLTSANVQKTLAIVLDDRVKAGATISEAIRESVQMKGFDRQDATDLALVLRTGALPIDLLVDNQQEIGASLGEDSVRRGLNAMALGFVLVIIFMVAYYRRAGIVADLALILNVFIVLAILSAFKLTLTLTSIAGLILTVGMAVDANVIIFERIKEERRLGKSPEASAKAGFRKAFWTVMDANITTFIAAIFLSQLAKGPIQGFAYTLAVGIVSSMFTALFVSRLVFDFMTETLHTKRLGISWRLR